MPTLKEIRQRLRDLRARTGNAVVEMGGNEPPEGEPTDGALYHIDQAVSGLTDHIEAGYNSPEDLGSDTTDDTSDTTDPEPEPTDVEPVFSDDFSSGDLSHSQNGYGWGVGTNASVADGVGRNGSHALTITYPAQADGEDSHPNLNMLFGGEPGEIWVDYWMKVPSNFNHRDQAGATNNKLFQLWGGGTRRNEPKAILEYQRLNPVEDGDRDASYIRDGESGEDWNNQITDPGADPFIQASDHGRRMRVRWHFKVGDHGAANSVVRLWKDDTLRHEDTAYDDLTNSDLAKNYLNHIRLFGWSNSGFDEETTFVIDDFKIYDSDPGW